MATGTLEAVGTARVYTDRISEYRRTYARCAERLGVTLTFGEERVVGSRGVFNKRLVSEVEVTLSGAEDWLVRDVADLGNVLAQDLCRR